MSATNEVPLDAIIEVDVHHGERTDIPIHLLVTPVAGRLRVLTPERFSEGYELLEVGQAVAVVELGDRTEHLVRSPVRGRLGAVLGHDGELVTPGQAVAWVERE
jgi:biotin carboxyl carrier protein